MSSLHSGGIRNPNGDDSSSDDDDSSSSDDADDDDDDDDSYERGDEEDDDDDEDSIESDSFRRREVISELHASSLPDLDLSDELWASSVAMESFQPDVENIIVALQSNRSLATIIIGGNVLAAIGESNQGSIFRSVGSLPSLQHLSINGGTGSQTAIHTRVLVDALSETSNGIKYLELYGFKISSRLKVEQLARGLRAIFGSLEALWLNGIELDVKDETGFMDPILLALAPVHHGEPRDRLSAFSLSCVEAALNRASVVSPEALGAFFSEEPTERPESKRNVRLRYLGLNDNHCEVMTQELARHAASLRPIIVLCLTCNPSIGEQGYAALLGLLDRRFDIGVVVVDDQSWRSTFDLLTVMNIKHERGRFLENGVYPSKLTWVNFLTELSFSCYWSEEDEDDEAQKLNAIWSLSAKIPTWSAPRQPTEYASKRCAFSSSVPSSSIKEYMKIVACYIYCRALSVDKAFACMVW